MRFGPSLFLITFCALQPVFAQTARRAILVDGTGPWRDNHWASAAMEFTRLLGEAGYTVATVSPLELPSAVGAPDLLLAVPSLESLPVDTFEAAVSHAAAGGSLMASGGEPFRNPLHLAPDGKWSPAPAGSFETPFIETLSPGYKQYTAKSGVRVPFIRGRGLSAWPDRQGRLRVIGDPLAPAATFYVATDSSPGQLVVWLPWPQVFEPLRAQVVAALRAAGNRLYLVSAGPEQLVTLPGEDVIARATILNAAYSPVQAVLKWSLSGASGATSLPDVSVSTGSGGQRTIPLGIGRLPTGDYTLTARLMIGDDEVDRIDSPLRVFDPTLTRRPDQKIRAVNGAFYAGGRRVFLHGVNYWPRYIAGVDLYRFNDGWLQPENYDPDLVEADLSLIASLNFNLVSIKYVELPAAWRPQAARTLMDFLERCRKHGIWVQLSFPAMIGNVAYTGVLNPALGQYLQAAYLPGNDRVFAYDLLWEPSVGSHDQGGQGRLVNGRYVYNIGRLAIDPEWRAWVDDQYGSLANAEQIWGFTAPRDANGLLTNPLDDQIANDGPWRITVAAYRRFTEDYFGRNIGLLAREIRRLDPDTLLTYRNWVTMTSAHNFYTGYDIGTAAAHLDFSSPEQYPPQLLQPDDRSFGLVVAYSRYRTRGQPVHWSEFGRDIGPDDGTPSSRAAQASVCDTMMRQITDDGSNAASVWWWPGGYGPRDGSDFGIIDPDGTPRDCASVLAQWGATFAGAPPEAGPGAPVTLTVDRDADARGSYGLFLKWQESYVQSRRAGRPVALADQGAGTDTATMPLIQAGNAPYAGAGPLKFANAEFGGVRVVCSNLDVTVENNATVPIPSGATCQITPTLVNTGEAQWLPASSPKGGVVLRTNLGDVPLTSPVPWLQRVAVAPLAVTMGQNPISLTGRLTIQGVGDFGEVLNVTLAVDATVSGPCAISLSSTAPIAAPSGGVTGTINITTADGCAWKASSPQLWVTVAPASGAGTGAVNYTIPRNTGPARQTTIMVAGHPFTVTQTANPNPPLAPAPVLSTRSVNFGSQIVRRPSAVQSVTVTNTSAAALNLVISIGGPNRPDFAQTNTCGLAVETGASCTIDISFTPLTAGDRAAFLFIDGSINGAPLAVSLSGLGAGTGPAPVIQAIVDSWGYTAGIAPGLWVTIGGTNMAGPPQTWNVSGLQQLPTTLGGVTVTFNGTPAALLYVSATQINALAPASVEPGPMQVVVQVNGVSSSPFTVIATPTHPAAYAPPDADSGTFFVTAALQGTGFLVGNSATDPRVVRAVYPGDIVDLYMIGLGATADASKFVTDRVFSGAFPVSAQVTATIGGESAAVVFAGLTAPGLYLVRISIPGNLAAGPQAIQVSAGGAQTRSPLVLMVQAAPQNLIRNGSFESALEGTWDFSVDGSAGAASSLERLTSVGVDGGSSALITVTSAAANIGNAAAVRLWQAGFALQQGEVYRLQFWAKADTARATRFDVVQNGGDSQNYGPKGLVALGADWQRYVIYFQATNSDPAAQLDLYFGDQTGSTWLDAVVLQGTPP